jgi:cobalt-zinc-cadmium efflux system membrane fusion protein
MKQLFYIPIILAATFVAAAAILNSAPPAGGAPEHEHGDAPNNEHDRNADASGHSEGHHDQVHLSATQLQAANLKIERAGTARITTHLSLYGKIAINEETMMHAQPRFPGLVKEVRKQLGEAVGKGDVLAVIESNESLRTYDLVSEVNGTVISKDATLGEFVKDDSTLFTIADLSTVWVDLTVFRGDFSKLHQGQKVRIHIGDEAESIESTISYISPFGSEGTQSMLARCVVPNQKGDLRPGLFVTAQVAVGSVEAKVAVAPQAVQTFEGNSVVFVQEGDAFEPRPVILGAADAARVQILKGLNAGEPYVSENSFILKAEIGKEEAEHEH